MSKENKPKLVRREKVETLSAGVHFDASKSRPRKGGGIPSDHSNPNNSRDEYPLLKAVGINRFEIPDKFKGSKKIVVRQTHETEMIQGRSVQWWWKHNKHIKKDEVEINGEMFRFK